MGLLKNIIREAFILSKIDITKNIEYDRITRLILKKLLKTNSNCIDVGCHKGDILRLFLKYAPYGTHYAFEPLPHLYSELVKKYNSKAKIFPYALSDKEGRSSFQYVKNAPAYSGIKRRRYDISSPEIEEIEVEVRSLDLLIPDTERIDFLKIDVEGGEFPVLKGAINLLKSSKPTILFESGRGASDFYGTDANSLFEFLNDEIGLKIFTLKSFISNRQPASKQQFEHYFNSNEEFCFIASNLF